MEKTELKINDILNVYDTQMAALNRKNILLQLELSKCKEKLAKLKEVKE